MKTELPNQVVTVDEAEVFLMELHRNQELYHLEDDAHDIIWNTPVGIAELDKLNILMNQCWNISDNFDPCEFMHELIMS